MGIPFENCKVLPCCATCFCCFWLIFTICALPLSFRTLEQGKYGLELNWHTQQISDLVVTEPGLKFVGLGNMIIEYPSTFQSMYFANVGRSAASNEEGSTEAYRPPIKARSQDGLEIHVSVSFQWKLEAQALIPLYNILGNHLYVDEMVRFARGAIVEACTHYPADQYFTNRTAITMSMVELISISFAQPDLGMHATIQGLQLREVDLPSDFNTEIMNTQAQMQEVEVAQAERTEQLIAKQSQQLVASERVNQTVQAAIQSAEDITRTNQATVAQMINLQDKGAQANALILRQFADDANPFERLFHLMEVEAMRRHNGTQLLVQA
jgi:regulator of protease activity HflC (stomatin/prohibitin superfamily)